MTAETPRLQERLLEHDVHLVELHGELDVTVASQLKAAILELINRGTRRLLVDLRQATFVDSATIGVLVGAATRLGDAGGTIAVVCTDPDIRETFRIAALDRIVAVKSSRAEALELVTGAGQARP